MNTESIGGLSLKSGFWDIRPAFKDDPHDPRGLHLSRSVVGLARDSQGRIYDRVRIIFASRLVWGAMFLDLFTESAPYMFCLLYTSPSPRDMRRSRMPSSA